MHQTTSRVPQLKYIWMSLPGASGLGKLTSIILMSMANQSRHSFQHLSPPNCGATDQRHSAAPEQNNAFPAHPWFRHSQTKLSNWVTDWLTSNREIESQIYKIGLLWRKKFRIILKSNLDAIDCYCKDAVCKILQLPQHPISISTPLHSGIQLAITNPWIKWLNTDFRKRTN